MKTKKKKKLLFLNKNGYSLERPEAFLKGTLQVPEYLDRQATAKVFALQVAVFIQIKDSKPDLFEFLGQVW